MLRRRFLKVAAAIFAAISGITVFKLVREEAEMVIESEGVVKLPEPRKTGEISVEEVINIRRSRRSYSGELISIKDISQLCWAAQGITEEAYGFRAAPSAGALYPLEIFLVVGNSELDAGIYQYSPSTHRLKLVKKGDHRRVLCEASLGQSAIEEGALCIVVTAIYERTTRKYGERGIRYVHMEAGHAAQNIYLQAEALGLGTVSIGAFYDDKVRDVLSVPEEYVPLYVMPVGHR
ncbi:SagB/ThcOx family dehydrogenase [Archaeoglobus veneficus]|uniref:SagB-type dehydrogenase domain protein n=1 Tax=Archaeoglobus veneficus (strain DSM 11195 / SNP6) TaxID=693661 RepID=F2KSE4_ARCVS|nr:SagB/ThcOx family dehydrogenase [Archaeoglobus veneficus]AEA46913.1 SagB-type dehydrogenase domain protein [Archaeoglobus veneficus SNP6]